MRMAKFGCQIGTQATLAEAVAYAATQNGNKMEKMYLLGQTYCFNVLGPNGANWPRQLVLDNALIICEPKQGRLGSYSIFWGFQRGNNLLNRA